MKTVLAATILLLVQSLRALEIKLLDVLDRDPAFYYVELDNGMNFRDGEAFSFTKNTRKIELPNGYLSQLITNIDSSSDFVIAMNMKLTDASYGTVFSISTRKRRPEILLDVWVKSGSNGKVGVKFRNMNGETENVVFHGVKSLQDGKWHKYYIHVYSVKENDQEISVLRLYVDCEKFETKYASLMTGIFTYRGIRSNKLEFRLAQRGTRNKILAPFKGSLQNVNFIFKRQIEELIKNNITCQSSYGKLPIAPKLSSVGFDYMTMHKELISVIKDLQFDLSMQAAEMKFLRKLVQGCDMCKVRDLCALKPCFPGVFCYNEPKSYAGFKCGPCPLGMIGDGVNCTDIDECSVKPCSHLATCINRSPGYACSDCAPGYTGYVPSGIGLRYARTNRQKCVDIDECQDNNGGCDPNSRCINTMGSYECGACPPGYVGDPKISCIFLRYCKKGEPRSNPCSQKAQCLPLRSGRDFLCRCNPGYAGDGIHCGPDTDLDGFPDVQLNCTDPRCAKDNCEVSRNPDQKDLDKDGIGDVCDDDIDGDGVDNERDNCKYLANPKQANTDYDLYGDLCDNCPEDKNPTQTDSDGDGMGDACDPDADGDGIFNQRDNCPTIFNADQVDRDGDRVGDACDNCPFLLNSKQGDKDGDTLGDACDDDIDTDKDGFDDVIDNCPHIKNSDQADADRDGLGDVCDEDDDNDGIPDGHDNCPLVRNRDQRDLDGSGRGDVCENDYDGDRLDDDVDACPNNPWIADTDFRRLQEVSLDPDTISDQKDPIWIISNNGKTVKEIINSKPGLGIGYASFKGLDFKGTMYVDKEHDDDYIGFIFSYENSRKFYAVVWKQEPQVYWEMDPFRATATSAIQLKLIHSKTGPGKHLRNSLWHTGTTEDQVKLLWSDPKGVGWNDKTHYRWDLLHRPDLGVIRLKIYEEGDLLVDSGYIRDSTLSGGRLGFFVFSQNNVIWENMSYKCNESVPSDLKTVGKV